MQVARSLAHDLIQENERLEKDLARKKEELKAAIDKQDQMAKEYENKSIALLRRFEDGEKVAEKLQELANIKAIFEANNQILEERNDQLKTSVSQLEKSAESAQRKLKAWQSVVLKTSAVTVSLKKAPGTMKTDEIARTLDDYVEFIDKAQAVSGE